jgi:hypothetical protein
MARVTSCDTAGNVVICGKWHDKNGVLYPNGQRVVSPEIQRAFDSLWENVRDWAATHPWTPEELKRVEERKKLREKEDAEMEAEYATLTKEDIQAAIREHVAEQERREKFVEQRKGNSRRKS